MRFTFCGSSFTWQSLRHSATDIVCGMQQQTGGNSVAPKRIGLGYNDASQFTAVARYKGLTASAANEVDQIGYSYDLTGRLTRMGYSSDAGGTYAVYNWAYDASSRLTKFRLGSSASSTINDPLSANPDNVDYTYDARDQLTAANRNGTTSDESYTYDANGNRTMSGYTTGQFNRTTSDGTYNYKYDDEGNLTKRITLVGGQETGVTTEYEWDHRNRLTRVTVLANPNPGAQKQSELIYKYDAFDRRIRKSFDSNGNGTVDFDAWYVFDGTAPLLDFVDPDGSGAQGNRLDRRYLHGPAIDQIFAEEDPTKVVTAADRVLWHVTDNLGTTRQLRDQNRGLLTSYSYNSFGNLNSGDTSKSRVLYTGQEYDADSKLYNYNARWYNPAIGKFMSEDPIGFASQDENLYRYVNNGPTNAIDPTGLIDMTPNAASYLAEAIVANEPGPIAGAFSFTQMRQRIESGDYRVVSGSHSAARRQLMNQIAMRVLRMEEYVLTGVIDDLITPWESYLTAYDTTFRVGYQFRAGVPDEVLQLYNRFEAALLDNERQRLRLLAENERLGTNIIHFLYYPNGDVFGGDASWFGADMGDIGPYRAPRPCGMGMLDWAQTALDVVGLIPGLGEAADGLNAMISLARGDYAGAALSFFAMVPGLGAAATAARFGRQASSLGAVARSGPSPTSVLPPAQVLVNEANFKSVLPPAQAVVSEANFRSVLGPQRNVILDRNRVQYRDPRSVNDFSLSQRLDLQMRHQTTIRLLHQGDVAAPAGTVSRHMLGELTTATGCEIGLIRVGGQRVLRLGGPDSIRMHDADRVIAHTHPSGDLRFSGQLGGADGDIPAFRAFQPKQRSSVLVGPDGSARRLPIPY